MFKARKVLLAAIVLAVLPVAPSVTSIALAGAENLTCHSGFRKIQTHTSSIKCFKQGRGYATAELARRAVGHETSLERKRLRHGRSLCNSTHGPVKMRVIQKNGRWTYQRWFTCVIIY